MGQFEKNKAELLEAIEQIAYKPLTLKEIRNLNTLYGAYKALCVVDMEDDLEPVKMRPTSPQTV